MEEFVLLARPFWVNLLILVPILLFFYFRKNKLAISRKTLFYTFLFGASFGVIEASVLIYLRAATGLLPGFEGTIFDVWRQSYEIYYNQEMLERQLPMSLRVFELIREIGTMVMLWAVAFIAASKWKERFAIFLFSFAAWDIFYYIHLWATVRWPKSLTTPDVLFLIPEPWFAQVWFPILVSGATMFGIIINLRKKTK
ncbi:MAG: hypothetical protein HYW63_01655 [Candidatus Levybacteria bacterium]|nr:hypothetical protein [Candidatus Levybacteria bacterium]